MDAADYHLAVRWVLANGILLLVLLAGTAWGLVLERESPRVEGVVQRYAQAVLEQDLERALAEVAPSQRERWRAWVFSQLGNIYDLKAVSVRSPSLIDRLVRRAPGQPTEVTVFMDVNRGWPDFFYQPTARAGVLYEGGRPYLEAPLLAPAEEAS